MPTRDSAISTGYKLEWSRWQQMRVTDFLAWQAALVREYRGPDQFVTHGLRRRHASPTSTRSRSPKSSTSSPPTPTTARRTTIDGAWQALQSATTSARSSTRTTSSPRPMPRPSAGTPPTNFRPTTASFASTSTPTSPAAPTWWSTGTGTRSTAGQETYWKGVLSHDLEPNRAYAEVTPHRARTAKESARNSSNMKIHNQVAILYSHRLLQRPSTSCPSRTAARSWSATSPSADYASLVRQFHTRSTTPTSARTSSSPKTPDFSRYKLLIVPALYVADDALLQQASPTTSSTAATSS